MSMRAPAMPSLPTTVPPTGPRQPPNYGRASCRSWPHTCRTVESTPRTSSYSDVDPPSRRERSAAVERMWWTLIAVSVAIFMLLLDITVVNVALPDIQKSLHSSFQDLQWVVDAYSLTLAAFLLTGGALADLLGRRRLFVIGLVVFTGASAVCGLSSTPLTLNLARGVQGIGGAL